MSDSPSMLKVADVARELNVNVRAVYGLINSGSLEAIRLFGGKNGDYRITRATLDAFIASRKVTAGQVSAQAVGQ